MIPEISKNLSELESQRQKILDGLYDVLNNLPDNKNIKRGSGNSFLMGSRSLNEGILAPSHYDFKFQYKNLVCTMMVADDPIKTLEKAIKERKFTTPTRPIPMLDTTGKAIRFISAVGETIKLHPDVIAELNKLF
jgi:hypothetical protein